MKEITVLQIDYKRLCLNTCQVVKETSSFIREEYKKIRKRDIGFKDRNDLVSYVDIETEKILIGKLKELVPDSVFLAEESYAGEELKWDKPTWIIDPLDGTTNYLHQIPVFSISVALRVGDEIKLGVVYEIMQDECFYSWGNGQSWLNESLINVTENDLIQHALLSTGFPFKEFEIADRFIRIFTSFMLSSRGIRRLGSAAVDLAYVACGRFDGFFEFNLNPWDVAAGAFIVEHAGGKVSDFKGGKDYLFGKEILASGSAIYDALLKHIKRY